MKKFSISFLFILVSIFSLSSKAMDLVYSSEKNKVTEKSVIEYETVVSGSVLLDRSNMDSVKTESTTKTTSKSPTLRTNVTKENTSLFSIYDAWISLDLDEDFDGYYSELTINFDADYVYNDYAEVYAEIYINSNGVDWELLYSTDSFLIYGNDSSDFYSVSLSLNTDFPTGQYDLLIDLYEVGYSGVAATISSGEDVDLYMLPLEDKVHEINPYDTDITYVISRLSQDNDMDGYYRNLELEYEINTFDAGRYVYAEIAITDTTTLQRRILTTDNFYLSNGREIVNLYLETGYPTSRYDVTISLVDVYTDELLETAGSGFSSLNRLPLESSDFDVYSEVEYEVVVSGGGSFGSVLILLLLLIPAIGNRNPIK